MPGNDRSAGVLGTTLYLAYLEAEADYPLRRKTHRYSAIHRDFSRGVKLSKKLEQFPDPGHRSKLVILTGPTDKNSPYAALPSSGL